MDHKHEGESRAEATGPRSEREPDWEFGAVKDKGHRQSLANSNRAKLPAGSETRSVTSPDHCRTQVLKIPSEPGSDLGTS